MVADDEEENRGNNRWPHWGTKPKVTPLPIHPLERKMVCTVAGGSCSNFELNPILCLCLVISPLKVWNYDMEKLQSDEDIMITLNTYAEEEKDYESVFGGATFDENGVLISAEAISLSYFLKDQSYVEGGSTVDPINEEWEQSVFLTSVQDQEAQVEYNGRLNFSYLSSRSFNDEFGGEITGDLVFVQVSYIIAFLFVGATLGSKFTCGQGSRWAMSNSVVFLVVVKVGGMNMLEVVSSLKLTSTN